MQKKELTKAVAEKAGKNAKFSDVVDAVFDVIAEKVFEGEEVSIRNFGKFLMRERAERKGRNPRTGEEFIIPKRYRMTFVPFKATKNM